MKEEKVEVEEEEEGEWEIFPPGPTGPLLPTDRTLVSLFSKKSPQKVSKALEVLFCKSCNISSAHF